MKNVKLTKDQEKEAYVNIQKACLRKFLNAQNKEDYRKGIQVLQYYFNPENPILDINAEIPGQNGWTPLCVTTWFGYNEETKELLKLGANPNISIGYENIKPIHLSAANGKALITQYYLSKGVYVDSQSKSLVTPLMRASEGGYFDVVQILMNKQPDIKLKDIHNDDCLAYANKNNNTNIVRFIQYTYMNNSIGSKSKGSKVTKI